jgi:mRNA-degrading endonuclease RelE of RelBE toxin-antitoxin system
MTGFAIQIVDLAADELRNTRPYDRQRILDEVHSQLASQPTAPTRNRKLLDAAVPDFEHVPPVWEMRVGDYRVFYDVDEAAGVVTIRAARRKRQGQTTEDIIHERDQR